MSTVVVLGAGGMLGHKICQRLRGHDVIGLVRGAAAAYDRYAEVFDGVRLIGGVDVLDGDRIETLLAELEPEMVVNGIGVVKQLAAAEDPYLATAINALLPHRLAKRCAEIGARLIHISTDCVFDGRRGGYRESDPTDARDLYGKSKALGETTPAETAAVTLRTSFIGRELKPRTHGLVEWFLAQDSGKVRGFAEVIYSGLTSIELTRVIQQIIDRHPDLAGTYQVASAPIDKYRLLLLLRQAYGLEVEIERAEEPVCDRSMKMEAFTDATGYRTPSWEDMVRELADDPTPYDRWQSHKEHER